MCATLHIADRHWNAIKTQYLAALEKGQVLPLETLPSKQIVINLIHQKELLVLLVSRPSQSEYSIKLNDTGKDLLKQQVEIKFKFKNHNCVLETTA